MPLCEEVFIEEGLRDCHALLVASENFAALGNEFRSVQAVTLPALPDLYGTTVLGPTYIKGFSPCNSTYVMLGILHPILF